MVTTRAYVIYNQNVTVLTIASELMSLPVFCVCECFLCCCFSFQNDAVQKAMTMWLQAVREWYPSRHSRSYFLPPLHFNRVPFDVATVAGQPVLVPQQPSNQPSPKKPSSGPASAPAPQPGNQVLGKPVAGSVWTPQSPTPTEVLDSDARDDSGTQHVLSCLRSLAEKQKEVMMVISQLDYRKYLDDKTDPISAAACSGLPRPATMPSKKYHRGDFDVLIIHPRYGLVVGEVKSVGSDPGNTQDLDKAIVKRVRKAVGQLHKAEDVLSHLVSDVAPVKISKTLILPSITSSQLLQALGTDTILAKVRTAGINQGSPFFTTLEGRLTLYHNLKGYFHPHKQSNCLRENWKGSLSSKTDS